MYQLNKMSRSVYWIITVALLMDVLSFSVILPALPQMYASFARSAYTYRLLVSWMHHVRSLVLTATTAVNPTENADGDEMDIVMVSGLLASVYALLQWLVSPTIGRLSDAYGRRRVLLYSTAVNVATCAMCLPRHFPLYVASRVVSGLTEANVQVTQCIITDLQ